MTSAQEAVMARKRIAISRVLQSGESINDVSHELGISRSTLSRWIRQRRNGGAMCGAPEREALIADFIRGIGSECAAAARDGEAPILAAHRLMKESRQLKDGLSLDELAFSESFIQEVLQTHGLRQRSQRIVDIDGRAMNAWVYYSPSEEHLFKAIEDDHPLLLAVTPEPHRFTRAVIERFGSGDQARPIYIWTSASGLFEIESRSGRANFHPIANADRIVAGAHFQLTYIPELRAKSDAAALRRAEQMREACEVGFETQIGDRRMRAWGMLLREDNVILGVVDALEDDDAEGPPLSSEEESDIERAIRDGVTRAREFAHKRMADQLQTLKLADVISHLLSNPVDGGIVVLTDGHHHIARDMDPTRAAINARVLKDAYYRLRRMRRGMKLILFAVDSEFPTDLREELQRIDLSLPSRAELEVSLRRRIAEIGLPPGFLDTGPSGHLTRLVDAACGMTMGEARTVVDRFAKNTASQPTELVIAMHDAKKKSIARSPALEVIDLKGVEPKLGGLDRLVSWLETRRQVFDRPEAARAAGIDRRPKGVLLLGIPGTGKSLAAKVVAKNWKLPLLRLDLGAVQDKWVGSSEARIREALKTVAAMSPCVLWIDELDKGIAQGDGTASHSTDLNIRATLLTWMQEYSEPIFIVATANRISHLPPELMRAGRFDARFFLGCPGEAGRRAIFEMHLARRRIDPETLDIPKLIAAMHGFTGAEIEQLVLDALYDAFSENEDSRPEMRHLESRLATTKPLIKTIGARDDKGRAGALDEVWALIDQGRVELASDDLLTQAQVARLIDPLLYRPVYCRKESVSGFEALQSKAERLSMGVPHGGAVAAVLDAGENWIFVYTNVRFDRLDTNDFKFVDRFETIENNGIFDTLVVQYGLEQIVFVDQGLRERFKASASLSQLEDLFTNVSL